MDKQEQIRELTEQIQAAVAAGDVEKVLALTDQLNTLTQPASFMDAWNFREEQPKDAGTGDFEKAWGFVPTQKG